MEGRFSKKGREDMLCTMQSGYIAPLGTFCSSIIMLVEDSKWGAAHSVHIRGLECKALGHFIRVLSTGKCCRGGKGGLFLACRSRLWVMAEWPGEGEIELCQQWGDVGG